MSSNSFGETSWGKKPTQPRHPLCVPAGQGAAVTLSKHGLELEVRKERM